MLRSIFLLTGFLLFSSGWSASSFWLQATADVAPIYQRIQQHPFNRKLLAGTLPPEIFKAYLAQDRYYLQIYNQVIHRLAGQLPGKMRQRFSLAEGINEEQALRANYELRQLTYANYTYTNFLKNTARHSSVAVTLAAILPCQWIYQKLYANAKIVKGNRYQRWLAPYQLQSYQKATLQLIQMANQLYSQANQQVRAQMLIRFRQAAIFEFRFWDDVYRGVYL